MKKAVIITLTDEELLELERILLDNDSDSALKALKKHLGREVEDVISGEGH